MAKLQVSINSNHLVKYHFISSEKECYIFVCLFLTTAIKYRSASIWGIFFVSHLKPSFGPHISIAWLTHSQLTCYLSSHQHTLLWTHTCRRHQVPLPVLNGFQLEREKKLIFVFWAGLVIKRVWQFGYNLAPNDRMCISLNDSSLIITHSFTAT